MSTMKFNHRPPLARSPVRVRPQMSLRSNSCSMETPPGSISKTQARTRSWATEEPELPPEYRSISSELIELAKMVNHEFGNNGVDNNDVGYFNKPSVSKSPLFERGRFYDAYSARRNERLKRKQGAIAIGETREVARKIPTYDLGVNVESSKRRDSKKFESARKSMSDVYATVDRSERTRYSLRSSSCKESKKPPLAAKFDKSVAESGRKIGAGTVRKTKV